MIYTITHFANDTSPALPDLDQNFDAAFLLTPVPCSIAGTNTLVFTQNAAGQAASGAIAGYANGLQLCGIAAQTNTSTATAQLGAFAPLNIYKDTITGPALLSGNEIFQNNSVTLRYDSSLNGGSGGWHLTNSSALIAGSTITPALVRALLGVQPGAGSNPTLTNIIAAQATLTYTAIVPNATQDQTFTVAGLLSTDALAMAFPLPSVGLNLSTYFVAGNTVTATVTVRCANITAASTITPGAITVGLKGIRTS